jgi:predicted nucleic acid-binding protein
MRIFFDSSALAKRYVREPGTDDVLSYCAEASEVIVSILLPVAVLSSLNRLLREKRLTPSTYRKIKRDLAADLKAASIVNLDESVVRAAVSCLERSALRSLDALHVASARVSACDLFVSGDRRQVEAARRERLRFALVGS